MSTSRHDSALNNDQRARALDELTGPEGLDVLVVGGGVTGAGIALDAAARGLRTGIVEMGDWASGTSSWSSKLVHGGLRYLYQLNFALVHEALTERGRLLTRNAPHLVKAQPFLWPLKHEYERVYSAVGVGMYDALAVAGARGHRTVPLQRHLTRKGTAALAPALDTSRLAGAIRFYDARVDDARLVIDLVRTAVGLGAAAANRTKVTGYLTDDHGRVVGAHVLDLATGAEHDIRAAQTINATGVWTEQTQDLATPDGGLKVLASKGIHIVLPKQAIDAETGIFLRTEKSVLFIIPWPDYWVVGTTDTPWEGDVARPIATAADIDYVLDHANEVLATKISRDNIIGVFAGLRPLLQPRLKPGSEASSAKVSREHTVSRVAPGLTSIAGGKLTTYRVMAADAVDFALGEARAHAHPCVTQDLQLVGAPGYHELVARAGDIARERGWTLARVMHLLDRYGDETTDLLATIDADPALGAPLAAAPGYLRAEVAWAVTREGAAHLDDILLRRVRLDMEQRDRGLGAADEILEIAAPLLGWDEARAEAEKSAYAERVAQLAAAETEQTDEAAVAHLTKPV
ncbi:glycerol-3-phosphate dehydrogenase/oxidase [Propionibacterium australiense]|uniref:Glycerol-3-phosphate dehydrogenase n=1 Tax=Propionibacterium australiense TaxID=119981 RepID=A0A383S662_9ACTN|nr:glycerol-3-phosphate dehydrogenase/oxidase [Propionibacterium australiense]RLP08145.1 FAD-dependent oxidoreductase [Propionibacterium australiense]RLP08326.1 FAD-dependent oxidoreductase [Propionibacterium australiense]SYZ33052.1 glycerol-3-phosphate dehydrogenase [Propionibacterium australiense]VEH89025.1 Aerobic glycerol-3-phosphate dehydrogenase [Propionibacterium australiense]